MGGGNGHFLEACFLCRRSLAGDRDIYMYRGDIPFCSEECRTMHMEMEEESEEKAKPKKPTQRVPSPREVEAPQEPHDVRAGSVLAL